MPITSFEPYALPQLPSIYYVPNYLGAEEESWLLTEAGSAKARWTQLSGRRLQNHGGTVSDKGLIPAPMPSWLHPLTARLHRETSPLALYGDTPPNHVLINVYKPGEGIMPHEDGPAYYPGVCILSLGAPAVIRFRRKPPAGEAPGDPEASLLLMPRSLLVFKDDAYTACTHGIDEVTNERIDASVCNLHLCPPELAQLQPHGALARGGERMSLTVRRVPRVIKFFGGRRL